MKIVVLDGYTNNPGDLSWEELQKLGDVTFYDRTSHTDDNEKVERIGNAQAIFVNKVPMTKAVIDRCENLKYIGVLATGYNIVDVDYAKEKGIIVCNVPSYGTDAVAQFVFALLLEICHNVGHHNNAVKEGKWSKSIDFCFWDFPLIELRNKTIGIIGYGSIGQATSKIAQAFGMKVLANANTRRPEFENENCKYVDLDTLLSSSDIISLHCPLTDKTSEIINSNSISKMKDNVIIINTSRGGLVNEQDLTNALNDNKVFGYGADVVSIEPIKEDNPLLNAKNCYLTPHIAWASVEARGRLIDIAINNLKSYMDGQPINVVNK